MDFFIFSQTLMNNHKLVTISIFAFLKYDKNDFISFLENIHEKLFRIWPYT